MDLLEAASSLPFSSSDAVLYRFRAAEAAAEGDLSTRAVEIGEALLESVDPGDDQPIEAAWNREILRRVTQIESGEVEAVDGAAGVDEVRDRLLRRRAP